MHHVEVLFLSLVLGHPILRCHIFIFSVNAAIIYLSISGQCLIRISHRKYPPPNIPTTVLWRYLYAPPLPPKKSSTRFSPHQTEKHSGIQCHCPDLAHRRALFCVLPCSCCSVSVARVTYNHMTLFFFYYYVLFFFLPHMQNFRPLS